MSDTFGPVLQAILAEALAALDAAGRRPGLSFIQPGLQVAFDNCCENEGQLWVRLIQAFPAGGPRSGPFPTADMVQACGVSALAARIGLGTVRCAHVVNDGGAPPSGDDMTSDALGIFADSSILLAAIEEPISKLRLVKKALVTTWTPVGPSGGCAGGEWEFVALIDDCSAV